MKKPFLGVGLAVLVVMSVVGLWLMRGSQEPWTTEEPTRSEDDAVASSGQKAGSHSGDKGDKAPRDGAERAAAKVADARTVDSRPQDAGVDESPRDDEETPAETAAEKAVKAFEDLTDALREPIRGDIALKRVDDFVRKFKALPKERQDEELHHALNLIPDDNSLFLLGVLMDAEVDKELKELVFNDFLNRGDEVKQPMLKAVFKQKSHPCWADAAWILDVTGALPAQKAQ